MKHLENVVLYGLTVMLAAIVVATTLLAVFAPESVQLMRFR